MTDTESLDDILRALETALAEETGRRSSGWHAEDDGLDDDDDELASDDEWGVEDASGAWVVDSLVESRARYIAACSPDRMRLLVAAAKRAVDAERARAKHWKTREEWLVCPRCSSGYSTRIHDLGAECGDYSGENRTADNPCQGRLVAWPMTQSEWAALEPMERARLALHRTPLVILDDPLPGDGGTA